MAAFDIYKRGQGKYTRLSSALAAALIVGIGCSRLFQILQSREAGDWIETMVPVGVFAVLGLLIYWIVNKPSVADFMISAESEMKKVSWSSRKEIAVSTFIVIVVVILMGILLASADGFFLWFFKSVVNISNTVK